MHTEKSKIYLFSVLTLLFLVSPALLRAQSDHVRTDEIKELGGIGAGGQVYPVKSRTRTSGSPYLSKDFVKGYIMINKDTKSNDIYLRYNIYNDRVEFLRNDKILASDPKKIYGFNIHTKNNDIKFRNGYQTDLKSISPSTLLRVAYNGETKLLVKYDVSLNEDVATYSSATKNQKYTKFKTYYVVTSGGVFHEIDDVKNDVLSILKDRDHKIRNYAESNSLNFNNEKDLIKILKYKDNF